MCSSVFFQVTGLNLKLRGQIQRERTASLNMLRQVIVVAVCLSSIGVWAAVDYSAPFQCCVCGSMWPSTFAENAKPQIDPSPFRIEVLNASEYYPTRHMSVHIVSRDPSRKLRVFMIQAQRIEEGMNEPMGHFTALNVKLITTCTRNRGSAAVSNDKDLPERIELDWAPPKKYVGHVEFRATFMEDAHTFWVKERSQPLRDVTDSRPLPPDVYMPPLPPAIDPIDTRDCGEFKGCYREPEGCWEPYCEYIMTFRTLDDVIEFELGAQLDGIDGRYVALALSDDIRMGNDFVFECVHDEKTGHVGVYQSVNSENKHNKRLQNPKTGILKEEGQYRNGRIRCRFTREKYPDDAMSTAFPLNKPYHLMVGKGYAHRGKMLRHGLAVGELPIVSPEPVSLHSITVNIGGRARYPLVKAHACLMILAWIFFATIGLLMAKYYKPMWPNSRFVNERYWFVAHFNCMAWLCLLVVIAFILIFIEAGGYSQAPELPQKAHPILGIIIFCCVVINPIIALIRPSEDSKWRPVFNWFHCGFGTIANCLAIPTIFIGMDFGKANIPWWSTWILVIYVLFHIIVEVTLEVHQCCTHKKNKERRKKYELQKRENPKAYIPEPEPAGRRFKRFMLALHFTITCIVTLMMVIIIAVC
ncbi:hypothetical protein ScPMuIL_006530 [Solemya velum]